MHSLIFGYGDFGTVVVIRRMIWPGGCSIGVYGKVITNEICCDVVIVSRVGCVVVIDWRDTVSYIYITKVFWLYVW